MELKVQFCDFWKGFDKEDNLFYNLLSKKYKVVISDTPDLLIYSCYGNDYLNYDCVRVFYTAENIRPDFTGCDYALTFDFNNNPRHYRLPLYGIYYKGYVEDFKLNNLIQTLSVQEAEEIWSKKTKFCCMVVSNGKAKKRIDFFNKLSKLKQVDSGGRYLNNINRDIGNTVTDKLNFISDYKFVLSFENSSYPGYTTEKILEPFFVHSIPVYWGSPSIERDFNKERFLHYSDFRNEDELIQFMLEIDKNDKLAIDMLTKPVFPGNELAACNNIENVSLFLDNIINDLGRGKPVARTKRAVHCINKKIISLKKSSDILLGRSFR